VIPSCEQNPQTACNSVIQALCKSLEGKDGEVVFVAHNPKVVSSNLPAQPSQDSLSGTRHFVFSEQIPIALRNAFARQPL